MKHIFTLITALVFTCSVNAQTVWTEAATGLPAGFTANNMMVKSASEVYAIGYATDGEICKTTNNGDSWSVLTTTGLTNHNYTYYEMAQVGSKYLLTAGDDADDYAIYSSTNMTSWTLSDQGIEDSFVTYYLVPVSATDVYAVGANLVEGTSGIYKSTNGGVNWTKVTVTGLGSEDGYYGAIWTGSKFLLGVVNTGGGTIYSSADGLDWEISDDGLGDFVAYDFILASPTKVYAVGANNDVGGAEIYVSIDGGASWDLLSVNGMDDYAATYLTGDVAGSTYFVCGLNDDDEATIFRSDIASGIEKTETVKLSIYPNPASDVLNVQYTGTKADIAIIDVLGKEVFAQNGVNSNLIIPVSQLQNGTYFVRVKSANQISSSIFVKR